MRKSLVFAVTFLLILTSALNSSGQKRKPKTDLTALRSLLAKALGEYATIVSDQLNQANGSATTGQYWLVSIQPKSLGHYAIKYRYNYNGTLYSHVERKLTFRVGQTGGFRRPWANGEYAKFCLGDTIILPIALEKFTEHEFSLKFTEEDVSDVDASQVGLDTSQPSANPALTNLSYIGSRSQVALHRAGGYTLQRYAVFEAKEPGRLNLMLSNEPVTAPPNSGGYAVIVVARDTPITAVLAHEQVEGFSKGFNGQEYSSSSGSNTNYLTNVLVIQTGDRFTFEFGKEVRSAEAEWKERREKKFDDQVTKPPFVSKLPFSFDKQWGYNNWISDWVLK